MMYHRIGSSCRSASAGVRRSRSSNCRGAFTLVEMLVAMAVTLILIFALSQAFALVGDTVAKGRAAIEMTGNLRAVANRLQADLGGVTVAVRPWTDAEAGEGYFEVGEGPLSSSFLPSTDKDWDGDGTYNTDPTLTDTTRGDIDDWLAFTTRNAETPFIGALAGSVIRSADAEIVWWIQYLDLDGGGAYEPEEKFVIYRRVMLVRPDQGVVFNRVGPQSAGNPGGFPDNQVGLQALKDALFTFYNNNDISVRMVWTHDTSNNRVDVRLIANSLADLTKRENRFAHRTILSDRKPSQPAQPLEIVPAAADGLYDALPAPGFPFPMDVNRRSVTSLYRCPKFGANGGEDVMVSDAIAFDVRVFDPEAPIRPGNAGEAMVPSDPGYFVGWADSNNDSRPDDVIGLGAFVDLGYGAQFTYAAAANGSNPMTSSLFSNRPHWRSGFSPMNPAKPNGKPYRYAYCTWSTHYERNGVDEDGSVDGGVGPDQGTNGVDDDGANGTDDVGERETSPPYPSPLRGIEVKIRAIDPDSRQIRQVTVVSDFIPE